MINELLTELETAIRRQEKFREYVPLGYIDDLNEKESYAQNHLDSHLQAVIDAVKLKIKELVNGR